MANTFGKRLKHAWNAFVDKDPFETYTNGSEYTSYTSSLRPDRPRMSGGNERSIIAAIYNRIAIDAAAIEIKHVKLDQNDRFIGVVNSGINTCLSIEANVDQTGRAFIQDAVMSMLDEGCVALVPIDTKIDPTCSTTYKIETIRTGKVLQWRPNTVQVRVYNDRKGIKEDIYLPKKALGIVENPLYAVMNEPNSTLQRLISKLNLLDSIDAQSGFAKLDIIMQLPYVIKTDARRKEAEDRIAAIESQLSGSKYGVAYTDGTEKITQLNRPLSNNLMTQIEYLTSMLYSQLGITQTVLDGTADEQTMLNYYNRTIEPILSSLSDEMKRKFLSKTARSQRQSIKLFRDPFRLTPVNSLAEISDKLTRNEILSSNEVRQLIGMKPSSDPKADELRNSNISESKDDNVSEEINVEKGKTNG